MSDARVAGLLSGTKSIAEYLDLAERQVRHLMDTSNIPYFKMGGTICCRRSTLDAWLAELEAVPRPPSGKGRHPGRTGRPKAAPGDAEPR
jgi:excisionase family DNA binding protein